MTSRELIAAEAGNTDRIALYREGLFWKAYERSAYALCTQVRPFKPTRKILKTLAGGDIVSVGFPAIAADRILAGLVRLDVAAAADSAAAAVGSDVAAGTDASDGSAATCAGAAGEVANASVGSVAAPRASSAAVMLLAAPRSIVESDFLAWKSALPISLSIPRPSAAETSCEDSAVAELPLSDYTVREVSLRGGSADRAVSGDFAASAALAPAVGGETFAAPAPQPRLWSRLGGWLVRWATGADASSHAVTGTAAAADTAVADPLFASGSAADAASADRILDALRKFEVADKTPMECMMFIAELKKRIL